MYQGHFRNGKKEGFGKFLWADKAKYDGDFHNNLEGKGRYVGVMGYEGAITACMALDASFGLMGRRMKAAMRHGKGIFTWPNGKQYDGIGRSNKMHHSAPMAPGRRVCGRTGSS